MKTPVSKTSPDGVAVGQPPAAQSRDDDLGPRWAFTLNGQTYPEIGFDETHPYELLRLQNASANTLISFLWAVLSAMTRLRRLTRFPRVPDSRDGRCRLHLPFSRT